MSKSILLITLASLPLWANAQLTVAVGVQKYGSLTNTAATLSGKSELWVTNVTAPLTGCSINLNSLDACLILPGIKPSVAVSSYLSQVLVGGAAAVADSNCRVVSYGMGAIILPHAVMLQPMQIFSGPYFTGAATNLDQYVYYKAPGTLGAFYGNIGSFKLKRGYAVTLAQNPNGSGVSRNYVAADGDMEISALPPGLDGNVQFVYVVPWRWSSKKGTAGDPGISRLNVQWWYNWNIDRNSTRDLDYTPIRQDLYSPSLNQDWKARGSFQLLGPNEPDRPDQANFPISDGISLWPELQGVGMRLGAPAVSDGGRSSWLIPFMAQADAAGLRVDFVPIHRYVCHDPTDSAGAATAMYNALKAVYDQVKRPIWVTEWNNGANWTTCGDPTYEQQAACVQAMIQMLDDTPWVERYAIYNWVESVRYVVTNGVVTPSGAAYRDQISPVGYVQGMADTGRRGFAQLRFETNVVDTSGFGNNGITSGCPGYTSGHSGQGIVFDGANTVVTLPSNIATNNAFSFVAWIKWSGGANWQRIFDFGNSATDYLYLTPSSGSGTLQFGIRDGGGTERVETAALPVNQWTHVAVTLSGSTATLYVNGVQAAQNSGLTLSPAAFKPVVNRLGKSQFNTDPVFSGVMDDVLIRDFALSAAQIARLQTNTPPQFTNSVLVRSGGTADIPYAATIASSATDANPSDTLTYSKVSGPAWLNVAANGTLSGTPTSGDGGTNYFVVAVTDNASENGCAVLAIPVITFQNSSGWIADASGLWNDTNNWSGGIVANGVNQTADFSIVNITADRTVTLDSSRSIGALRFSDASGSQSWTLTNSGNSMLTLNAGINATPSIVVTNTLTLAAPLAGTNGFVKSGPGLLVLTGNNSLAGTVRIDTGSNSADDGTTRLSGPDSLGNANALVIGNMNTGKSTLELDGSPGSIIVNADVSASGRNNGVVTIRNLAGTNVFNGNFYFGVGGNSYTFQADASSLMVYTAPMEYVGSLVNARTYYFTGAGDHLVVGAILAATNGAPISISKTGGGTLTLQGENTYTNGTTLTQGTLLVNGILPKGDFSIASGTTIGGSGMICAPFNLTSGATLSPGVSIGVLTVSNNFTLNAGSTTRLEMDRSIGTNDQLRVIGAITYGGTLVVTNYGGDLAAGDNVKLFDAAGGSGTFAVFNLPALAVGLAWDFNPVTGVLAVGADTNTAPVISLVANQVVVEDNATAALPFVIGDAETAATNLSVNGFSSNPALVPISGIQVGGSGTNRTVRIVPATNQNGVATITLAVSDGHLSARQTFAVTVTAVNDAPTISAIAHQTWNKNIVIGPLDFSVVDPETAAGSLAVTAASSNPSFIPVGNIFLGGSGANRTVTITPATNQGGVATITLTVSDGLLTATESFVVTITVPVLVGKANNAINLNLGSSWIGGVVPGSNSVAVWNSTVTSANAVLLGANASWSGIVVSNPVGPVSIEPGNTLTLGASGINLAMASQGLTIKSGLKLESVGQTWTVTNSRTLTLTNGAFTRTAGGTVNIQGGGTVAASQTGFNNDASENGGLLGPWATIGAGSDTAYATLSGGNIVPYASLVASSGGTIASTANSTTDWTLNGMAFTGNYGNPRTVSTLRYTFDADNVINLGNNTTMQLTLNGILNSGAGKLTVQRSGNNPGNSGVTIGANNGRELVLHAANGPITVTAPIANNGGGASSVTIAGVSPVTLAGANSYTGSTVVNGILQAGATNTIPAASALVINGTLDLAAFPNTVASLAGAGTIDNSVATNATLTVNGAMNSVFSGTLKSSAGALALVKSGIGTLTLTSGNLHTGGTVLNGGTLALGDDSSLGSGGINLNNTGAGIRIQSADANARTFGNALTLSTSTTFGAVGTGNLKFTGDMNAGNLGKTITVANVLTEYTGDISGNGSRTKAGDGALLISGTNLGTGAWTLNAGSLLVNGSLGAANITANVGILGGTGDIGGAVVVQPGATLAPGNADAIGQLTIKNDITLAGSTVMQISQTLAMNDRLVVSGEVIYGGTLIVTNLSGVLGVGDEFQLFSATFRSGTFANLVLPPLSPGMVWSFSEMTGELRVIFAVATNPTNIVATVTNGELVLSWPSDHIGWRLQVQTNSLNTGLGTNWIDVPGTSNTNQINVPLDVNSGSIFYRMIYP